MVGWGESRAGSEDGAAAAVPLRVVRHMHPVVGAVDVVDISLPLVPVVNFCEGDQLDGLALRRQSAGKNFSVLFESRTIGSSLLPGDGVHALELAPCLQSAFLGVSPTALLHVP